MKMITDAPVEVVHWDYPDKAMPRDKLLAAVKGCDACLCLLTDKINAEFFDAAGPQLKTVATMWLSARREASSPATPPVSSSALWLS